MQATLQPIHPAVHFGTANSLFLSPADRHEFGNYSRRGDVDICDNLPKDPRQWTREDVQEWLQQVSKMHNLPDIQHSRFLMNGKALCLMSQSMFISRVPLGGKLLFKDFQLRLCAAMHTSN